jgi:hypothetical protein
MSDGDPEDSIYPSGVHRLTDTHVVDSVGERLQELDPRDEYGRDFDETPVDSVVAYGLAAVSQTEYWRAVHALRRRGTRQVFDAVARLARDPRARGRLLAADVLAQLGARAGDYPYAEEALPYLLPLLDDPEEAVQAAAGHAFGNHTSAEAVPQLVRLSRSQHPEVRLGSVFGLQNQVEQVAEDEQPRFDSRALEGLLELTRDPDRDVRDWATYQTAILAMASDDELPGVRAALWERVEDEEPEIRSEALEGLAELGDREIVPILVRQMEGEAGDDLFWLATIDAAKAIALPALVPHLQAYRAALAESHAADFSWLPWVDEAIAACSAPTDSASGP